MEISHARFDEDASGGATNQPWVNESQNGNVLLLKYLINNNLSISFSLVNFVSVIKHGDWSSKKWSQCSSRTSKSSVLLQSPGRMFLLELYDSMINQHACSLQMVARLKMSQIRWPRRYPEICISSSSSIEITTWWWQVLVTSTVAIICEVRTGMSGFVNNTMTEEAEIVGMSTIWQVMT